ncbi:Uncharacterized protein OBRU01_22113 [Operophtera brumata]|uniref:Uncharacterized protein n=1 Tax=Operophtera brumata TaxID=104452 RepID=A0A0L7KI07_OPEBR|nr:Uncharacterized protein OBRU01_22113 [Operophtera brumata]
MTDEDLSFAHRSNLRRPKIRIIPSTPRIRNGIHKDPAFEPTRFSSDTCIRLKIKNCRTIHVPRRHQAAYTHPSHAHSKQSIVVASGLLLRFKYKLNKPNAPPYLGALLL